MLILNFTFCVKYFWHLYSVPNLHLTNLFISLMKDASRTSFPEHFYENEPDQLSPSNFTHGQLVGLVRTALEEKIRDRPWC